MVRAPSELDVENSYGYFLKACQNVGFTQVDSMKELTPCTIYRKDEENFVLAMLSSGGELLTVPIRILNLLRYGSRAKEQHGVVTFHAEIMSTRKNGKYRRASQIRSFMRMLRSGANGSELGPWRFWNILKTKCEEFLGQEVETPPQLLSIMECSDDDESRHTACGVFAEEYFLKAMKNLGFEEVETGKKMMPPSIRRTTDKEDAKGQDFIIRLPGFRGDDPRNFFPIMPLQLTLEWSPEKSKSLSKKMEAEHRGEIALIWAGERFAIDVESHGLE